MAQASFGPGPDKAFPNTSYNGIAMILQMPPQISLLVRQCLVVKVIGRRDG